MIDASWQQVTCKDCKRAYQCTPADDYYENTTLDDGQCFGCLLRAGGLDPETTKVRVLDADLADMDPRDVALMTPADFGEAS